MASDSLTVTEFQKSPRSIATVMVVSSHSLSTATSSQLSSGKIDVEFVFSHHVVDIIMGVHDCVACAYAYKNFLYI